MKLARPLTLLAVGLAAAACATTPPPAGGAARAGSKSAPAFLVADLRKMTVAELDAALGAPALTRIEGAGEFRRYMLDACALMIILYPDEKGERRVARMDAGALVSGSPPPDLDACLAAGKTG